MKEWPTHLGPVPIRPGLLRMTGEFLMNNIKMPRAEILSRNPVEGMRWKEAAKTAAMFWKSRAAPDFMNPAYTK